MKKLAFGCMRLPMIEKNVDIEQFKKMVDIFLENGFDYFDTAKGYIDGQSEKALKEGLTSRYPRSKYTLTDKLSSNFFKSKDDLEPLFEEQLKTCGVEYFDNYLIHAVSKNNFNHYESNGAFDFISLKKKEGKIKRIGMSYHDSAEFLEEVLTKHPEIEVVQLQLNYIDFEDKDVQARKCYDVCVKHNKKVLVMEPVKGGLLVNIPEEAKEIFNKNNNGSVASYAIRFAASLENVERVLSGMSSLEQMEDNISFMKDFKPLNDNEMKLIDEVVQILRSKASIPCTGCRYCVKDCPAKIVIPDILDCLNKANTYGDSSMKNRYRWMTSSWSSKASACLKCGKCENTCPQHLQIRKHLEKAVDIFEK